MEKEVNTLNKSLIKVLGILATVVGIGANLLSDFVGEKQTDAKIQEKIDKALAEKNQ